MGPSIAQLAYEYISTAPHMPDTQEVTRFIRRERPRTGPRTVAAAMREEPGIFVCHFRQKGMPIYWSLAPGAKRPMFAHAGNGRGSRRWKATPMRDRVSAVLDAIRKIAEGRDEVKAEHFDAERPKWLPSTSSLRSTSFGPVSWYEWLAMAGVAHKCSPFCTPVYCGDAGICGGEIVTGRIAEVHEYAVLIPMCADCARLFDEEEERWTRETGKELYTSRAAAGLR